MNSKKLKTAALLLTVVCLTAVFSCKKDDVPSLFRVRIDSISARDTARAGDTITVHLDGYIGPNKCYVFDNAGFYPKSKNDIVVEAFGEIIDNGLPCKEEESLLDDDIRVVLPATAGTYTFKAIYDADTTAIRKIVVEESDITAMQKIIVE
ncbi:MAG: hypothetical protein LBV26_08140 [Bacteroidales bacterium]|jgi:hypothetical protein|nr:hypothetical protein [Bacteroidales bacterium]